MPKIPVPKTFNKKERYLTFIFVAAAVSFSILISPKAGYNDFEPYYLQAKAIKAGTPAPYDVRGTTKQKLEPRYPLTYSLLLVPLTYLEANGAKYFLYVTNIVLLLIALIFLQRTINLSVETKLLLWTLSFLLFPVLHCLGRGQVGIILFFIVVLSFYFYTRKSYSLSAFLLALGASIKVIPGFLIVLFVVRKKYAYCLKFLVFFLLSQIVTGGIAGWANTLGYWTEILPSLNNIVEPYIYNQSLLGYLHRILEFFDYRIPSLNQIVSLGVLGTFTVYLSFKHKFFRRNCSCSKTNNNDLLYELGVMLVLINVSTPIGWPHQFVWIIIPLAYIFQQADKRAFQTLDTVIITIALFLLLIPIKTFHFRPDSILSVIQSAHIMMGAILVLIELWRLHPRRISD